MFITDLDGTLANVHHQISSESVKVLHELGERGVIRVIATGRNLHSSRKVLSPSLPFDYLIFSGGVGIIDWPQGELLHSSLLSPSDVSTSARWLLTEGFDFMIQASVPDNHHFQFWKSRPVNPDFQRRCEVYAPYCRPWDAGQFLSEASQIIVVESGERGIDSYRRIQDRFPHLSVVRSTSPLDHQSVWIELSAPGVTKAAAAAWICRRLNISGESTAAVGNDYNDLHLLDWVSSAYVVGNAPPELQARYQVVTSNEADGFAAAVRDWWLRNGQKR